jgi:alpha-beta hydrolase superfamily lysophospholipase
MQQLRVPVLLIGGGKDTISRPEDLVRLKTVAGSRVKILEIALADHFSLPMAVHLLSKPIDAWLHVNLTTSGAD